MSRSNTLATAAVLLLALVGCSKPANQSTSTGISSARTPAVSDGPDDQMVLDAIRQRILTRTVRSAMGAKVFYTPCSDLLDIIFMKVVDKRVTGTEATLIVETVVRVKQRMVPNNCFPTPSIEQWLPGEERLFRESLYMQKWESGWRFP